MKPPAINPFRFFSSPLFICFLLALATLAVYAPVRNYGFVSYDDGDYFFNNPHVLSGLSRANADWAFTSGEDVNWHPLTWLSFMLDAQFFGKSAMAPHVTNVLLHAANSILVFLLLRRWTGALWRSAAVAMLFAIHPMHVESVAWVAERKDVLSGFFALLALLAWTQWVRKSGGKSFLAPSYWLSLFFFLCGLMSKPMLVTLPFVLLLLDFWPFQRLDISTCRRLFMEKVPFFLLSAATCVVTYLVQQKGGAVTPLSRFPLGLRMENVFISYARYLFKIFWPVDLATPYPAPEYRPLFVVVLAVVLFAALGLLALAGRKKFPFVFTGWFWFAGMLVPVIGLVQVGAQSMGDRYVYLPMIGILVMAVWGGVELCRQWQLPRRAIFLGVAVLFLGCGLRARNQVTVWQNDETLFGHALAVTRKNYFATLYLAQWYEKNGQMSQSLEDYYRAAMISPGDATDLYNAANSFAELRRWREAIDIYRRALRAGPNEPDILNNLGLALAQNHQLSEAAGCFQRVLQLEPDSAGAHNNLGTLDFIQGNFEEASNQFSMARQLSPNDPGIDINLGDALIQLRQTNAAVVCYRKALGLQPGNASARARLQALRASLSP